MMKFEITKHWLSRLWRWRLRAANGEIVASGESYHNYNDCLHAISLVKASHTAPVRKL